MNLFRCHCQKAARKLFPKKNQIYFVKKESILASITQKDAEMMCNSTGNRPRLLLQRLALFLRDWTGCSSDRRELLRNGFINQVSNEGLKQQQTTIFSSGKTYFKSGIAITYYNLCSLENEEILHTRRRFGFRTISCLITAIITTFFSVYSALLFFRNSQNN